MIKSVRQCFMLAIVGMLLNTHAFSQNPLFNWNKHQVMEEESIFGGMQWAQIGPEFMGGRVESIALHPDDPGTMYLGFGSGSLWKTSNGGLTWSNIFSNQGSFSIGDLAVAPSDPDVLWLGTGEQLRASRGYTYSGTGIYLSRDGGETWVNKGLNESYQIGKVVVDPYDSEKVFVSVIGHFWAKTKMRGLYYTENGGDTWQALLQPGDSVGVVDMVWDANNQTIYACTWQMPQGTESAVYKSEDLGQSWQKMEIPFENPENTGRLGIDMSSAWPNVIYVIRDNRSELPVNENQLVGAEIFKSDDYGISWTKTHANHLINYAGFGWAFGDIIVHPTDPEEIFIGGVHLMRSVNGGKTFDRIGGQITHLTPNISGKLHLDQHDFHIRSGMSDTWILGNDGGLFISVDEGQNWMHYNNIPTGEFYDVNVLEGRETIITGGIQDNSNIIGRIDPDDFDGPWNNWDYVWLDPWSGGDGFTCLPDPENPDWVYWESQNGHLNKKNLKTGENLFIKPKTDSDESPLRNSWFTPFLISPFNYSTLYYAANKVYKSLDKGDNWMRLSHDLTFTDNPEKKSRSITRMAVSTVKPGIIYAGTEKGAVWVSRNEGRKWHEISDGIPNKKVVDILPSSHDLSRVYIVVKGMDQIDPTPYIYLSNDFGSNWKMISKNLPNVPINCILEDPKIDDLLVVGTDAGIFVTRDRGNTWESISLNLPTASYVELRWMNSNKYLLAATHGQGLFYCHFELIQKFTQSGYVGESKFLGSIPGKLPVQNDYSGDWNNDSKAPLIISWFSSLEGPVLLKLFQNKKLIFTADINGKVGLNQFAWDLIIEEKSDQTNYPLPEITFPKAGRINAELNLNPIVIKGEVEILPANQ